MVQLTREMNDEPPPANTEINLLVLYQLLLFADLRAKIPFFKVFVVTRSPLTSQPNDICWQVSFFLFHKGLLAVDHSDKKQRHYITDDTKIWLVHT